MKRSAVPLVDYDDNDDDSSSDDPPSLPPEKKRKLPALSGSLATTAPVDNPALHQGRVRTTPYVEGQYAAYVYVPVALEPRSKLLKLVRKVYRDAKKAVPTLHPIESSPSTSRDTARSGPSMKEGTESAASRSTAGDSAFDLELPQELHVSLSRPIFLRAHQLGELKRAVKSIAASHSQFTASFATFSNLTNDERTRTFLSLEIGAGHSQLSSLSTALTSLLRSLRQKSFYSEPRFHASFAWALLSGASSGTLSSDDTLSFTNKPCPSSETETLSSSKVTAGNPASTIVPSTSLFPTIAALPASLVPDLVSGYALQLASPHVGSFEVTHMFVKIGKSVSRFKLGGSS
ncbi:hypothetical protein NEOLEDRAFT_1165226 [Neolentinus lepideus HHB14362 ss-1]|uniref:U6 snRNA phosphodiesterase 1 n=1 Tax=Neolentinus lepideus HHB14362 ss-1 TaxID=1314782 RepID=A0A165NRY1_9AGAM|nr:hypothetical protein NEOLEDRAFT_1165226 [Neolentinus lepideus HHB14362 ss-1]